jgi:hypothetical protein
MMTQENLYSVLTFTTPGIIRLLMENRNIGEKDAAKLLYNSELYKTLEDEESKLWRLSYPLLYDLLEEELTTGKIKNWPEEQ